MILAVILAHFINVRKRKIFKSMWMRSGISHVTHAQTHTQKKTLCT